MSVKKTTGQDAKAMAAKIREISISEFFSKNRHLLGFDNPVKSLLTAVREAVDNALDACEEAHILPEIKIEITEVAEGQYQISVEDNGPGIIKSHLPNIFGKLLYGSKFHRLKQSRGQQGIGISAAVMYGQMTTGKAAEVISKTGKKSTAHKISLQIDTKKNAPKVLSDKALSDKYWEEKESGTKISMVLEGAYKENKHGVLAYISQTALSNPHASFSLLDPKGQMHEFPRLVTSLPIDPQEIKPHPLGIELGTLIQFLNDAKAKTLQSFLKNEFSRVTDDIAKAICKGARLSPDMKASAVDRTQAEAIFKSIQETKLMSPPTNCLSPLSEQSILKALYWFFVELNRQKNIKKEEDVSEEIKSPPKKKNKAKGQVEFDFESKDEEEKEPEAIIVQEKIKKFTDSKETAILSEEEGFFVTAISRPPSVYRGNPFQVEVGLFYGRSMPADDLVQVYRYANRVPLQYQAAACAMTKALLSVPWKSYGLQQSKGAMPAGPVVMMISISSVWVPYTSESKEAVAHYEEIIKELRLSLMEAGRRLSRFINKRKRHHDEAQKRSYIEKYMNPIQEALSDILGNKAAQPEKIAESLRAILEKHRAHKEVKMIKREISA